MIQGRAEWLRLVDPFDEELARLRCEQFVRETQHWLSVNERKLALYEFRATGLAAQRELDRWADDGGRATATAPKASTGADPAGQERPVA